MNKNVCRQLQVHVFVKLRKEDETKDLDVSYESKYSSTEKCFWIFVISMNNTTRMLEMQTRGDNQQLKGVCWGCGQSVCFSYTQQWDSALLLIHCDISVTLKLNSPPPLSLICDFCPDEANLRAINHTSRCMHTSTVFSSGCSGGEVLMVWRRWLSGHTGFSDTDSPTNNDQRESDAFSILRKLTDGLQKHFTFTQTILLIYWVFIYTQTML